MRGLLIRTGFLGMIGLSGCSNGGNIKTAADYHAPKPPAVSHPIYQPYASYGQVSAIWSPPVADRNGTVVRPADAAVSWDRPDYEGSSWAKGAAPSRYGGPAGTF